MIRKTVRRLITLGILVLLGYGFYEFGNRYLWPPRDLSRIDVVGIIEAPEVNITSRIAGRIISLNLVEGDRVKRGQVVCEIEYVDLRNQLRRAEADVVKADAELAQARRDLERIKRLFDEHVISVKQRDDAVTAVEQAEASLASARANVSYYQDQLRDTKIVSPVDGIIVNKALEVGEWVTPGTPILTVDDLDTIWARVDLEETDLSSIYVGKPARVRLPTNPPVYLSGRVMAIGQEGQFATERDVRRGRQDIRTFYVKVQLLQPGDEAKPGMTAEVSFLRNDGTRLSRNSDHRPDQALR
jgi:HlyD family secretion protein